MTADRSYTAREIAEHTGISRVTIMRRANRENWQMIPKNGNGGTVHTYSLPALPPDVQLAIYNKEGAPAEMLPFLSPTVALAAAERRITPPSLPSFSDTLPAALGKRLRRAPGHRVLSHVSGVAPAGATYNNKDANPTGRLDCAHSNKDTGSHILPQGGGCDGRINGFQAPTSLPIQSPGLEPARRYAFESLPAWSPERAISEATLRDERVGRILAVLREVEAMPRSWTKGKDAWLRLTATKHGVARQSVYRWLRKYDKRGIAGLEHRKSSAGKTKAWTPEALEHWLGLTLKPEMRKMTLQALYEDCLLIEAHRRNWRIGCYESAIWWYNKMVSPQMRALRDGGMLALDNLMPPVLRSYSDLTPFEMLVGDQHRFDFWVVDDDTGAVFRPECYLWQDLRTRVLYGAAFDRRYDAHLCGEALRVGMMIYGCFNAIYTDNGSSELSKYMMGILSEIRRLGMEWKLTEDIPADLLDVDGEEILPIAAPIAPGTHRRAIVKNAKAKLIEKTFAVLEEILRSRFRVPGSVKRLTDDIHTQDVDHQEAVTLAAAGRLLLASEFYLTVYRAMDWYNREKAHRGVLREWAWKPVPATATPMDCLMACYRDGWRPLAISDEAADMVFLKRINRPVRLGRITVDREIYEHDALLELPQGQSVECRIRPFEADVALVYLDGKFLCAAHPVEYSSMKDGDLARRKILEKREKRKAIADRFRAMIKSIPDLREYSKVPEAEKVAALVGEEKKRIEAARANLTRALPPEDLAAEVAKLEALNERLPDGRTAAFAQAAAVSAMGKPIPPRPGHWLSEVDRHLWCVKCEAAGGELSVEDRSFVAEYEAKMTPAQRERWQFEREYGNG